ncbi:MAG: ClpXP protease specificity-enhancing factor [Gammaproteobacteria bacterium]|nr:ClpXP protease specificity-enhancing factor [Gammaproteobacteria bacterium]
MRKPRSPGTPTRAPYFLRAMHEWISDAGMTPQIIVDARMDGVQVPAGSIDEQGRIVLNIGLDAVRGLALTNEKVSFKARFAGTPHSIFVPIAAVQGIYARESGEGIVFNEEVAGEPRPAADAEIRDKTTKPTLKIVK